ncbi:MAG: outer membrane protein [Bacteroidota bacterium]|jgi:outer membrane protein TolC|nr:type secretion outer membrane protein [Methermicoccus sp.]MBZ4674865.1 type secretion outer membrane protein [Dysgonamonadaceae bacterium]MDK2969547.1 outer membrane protein [Bacteroidota bacterium]MDN5296337.1 outer membrane protein [Bacteroidota bacterium]
MKAKTIRIMMLVCGLLGLSNANAQQRDSLSIDLNTALEIALSENPNIKIADMEITKKQYAKKSAYGALLPEINLIGQYQRTIKKQTMYLDGGFFGGDIDPTQYTPEELKVVEVLGKMMTPAEGAQDGIQVGRWNMYTGGLNVSLPLVVPSLWKNIQMSEIDIQTSMEQARSSKINLVNQVTKSFYSLMLAHDSYMLFRKTYVTDSINLENITNKYKQGIVPEYDVITADVRLKSIIPSMLQAENMMKIAELQLKLHMGIDNDIPLKIVGTLDDYDQSMFDAVIPADTSLLQNSDLRQFDLQAEKVKKMYEMQKLQFAPSLVSSFQYTYISQNNDFKFSDYKWNPYSTVGITLSIPLFNGGQRYNNLKQTELQINQLQYQRVDLQRNLKLAVKNNIDLINKNIEQIVATQSSVEQARKGYDITLKRYETGMGTIVELNSAALGVTNAELQYKNAIYDYLAAKADLEKVLGYTIEPVNVNK